MKSRGVVELLAEIEHECGDPVHHRATRDMEPGIVTGILIRPQGVVYAVTWPNREERYHYGIEISKEFCPATAAGGTRTE